MNQTSKKLTIPDLISVGVFTAIYFVLVTIATFTCALILSISVDRKNSKSKHIMQPLSGQHKICCASPWVVSRHWRNKYGDCSNSS